MLGKGGGKEEKGKKPHDMEGGGGNSAECSHMALHPPFLSCCFKKGDNSNQGCQGCASAEAQANFFWQWQEMPGL